MAVWDVLRWRPTRAPMAFHIQQLLNTHRDRLPLADLLLNFFLLTPLVVLHYHATCQVLDYILVSTFPRFGPCLLFVAGIGLGFAFAYYQRRIPRYVAGYLPDDGENRELFRAVAFRLYTFALTFVTLSHMKAVTDLFLQSSGGSLEGAVRAATTSIIVLWGMRGSRNILGPPLTLGLDQSDEDYHVFSTAFSTEPAETVENAADVIATIGVGYTMNHLHWAGITTILDNLLFPDHFWLSVLGSLVLGYAICFLSLVFQHHAKHVSRELEREALWKKLVFENAYIFLSGFGVITTWRGIWMTFDAFTWAFPVFVIGTDVTCFVGFLFSFVTLMTGQLVSTLPYKGFDRDGDVTDGDGCLWSNEYLISLIQDLDRREKEAKEKSESEEANTTATAISKNDDVNQNSVLRRQPSKSSEHEQQTPNSILRRRSADVNFDKGGSGSAPAQNVTLGRQTSASSQDVPTKMLNVNAKSNGPLRRNLSSKSK